MRCGSCWIQAVCVWRLPSECHKHKESISFFIAVQGCGVLFFFSLHLHGQLHISWPFLPFPSLFPDRFLESYLSPFLHKPFVGLCQLKKWRQPRCKISTKIQTATESSPGLWPHEWRTSPWVSRYSMEEHIPCKYQKSTSDLFDYKLVLKYRVIES